MIAVGVRAHDYGCREPEQLFSQISQDGFSCVQLAFQKAIAGVKELNDLTSEIVNRTAAAMKGNRLSTAVFGAYTDLALPDRKVRDKNAELLLRCLPYAKRLGAGCVGLETTAREKQGGMSRRDALRVFLETLEPILREAENTGVILAIEPVFAHTVNTPECALQVLRAAASPNLKVIFDPCNLLSPKSAGAQREIWDRMFHRLGKDIVSVHFKGRAVDRRGQLYKTDLAHSVLDYPYLFEQLKKLPQNLSILREEANPAFAARDCAFLKDGLLK
ncbi:hypothetical protein A7X67_02070 [Clostridium sp. W14A]|nr:hypothetical protein A7X67_02070 [Clostridium sp. W14A]